MASPHAFYLCDNLKRAPFALFRLLPHHRHLGDSTSVGCFAAGIGHNSRPTPGEASRIFTLVAGDGSRRNAVKMSLMLFGGSRGCGLPFCRMRQCETRIAEAFTEVRARIDFLLFRFPSPWWRYGKVLTEPINASCGHFVPFERSLSDIQRRCSGFKFQNFMHFIKPEAPLSAAATCHGAVLSASLTPRRPARTVRFLYMTRISFSRAR